MGLTKYPKNNMAQGTLEDAIQYAKKNPSSDFARQLKIRIESGAADQEAADLGVDLSPFGRPSIQRQQRVSSIRGEAQQAEKAAQEAQSPMRMLKETAKGAITRLGEGTGITPTAKKIAAGVAPFVTPEEDLPAVLEDLAGGIYTPEPSLKKEAFETAIDLPIVSLGLSKTLSQTLAKQLAKDGTALAKPLSQLLPKEVLDTLQKELGNPITAAKEKVGETIGEMTASFISFP